MAESWIALMTRMRLVGWTSKLKGGPFAAWIKFLMTVKDCGKRGGLISVNYLDKDWLRKNNVTLGDWSTMLAAAIENKAVKQENGVFTVVKWDEHQRDPTGAERQEKWRKQQPKNKSNVSNGNNGNRTGQDRTGQDHTRQDPTEVFNAWNSLNKPFPKLARITKKRLASCRLRLADPWWREHWREALKKVKASAFCRGENDRGWVADIEFFLRPDSAAKAIEGKYDDRAKPPGQGVPQL